MDGCSSHNGRRAFVTKPHASLLRQAGHFRDVQQFAGHRFLQTTRGHIDENSRAKRRVVEMI